MPGPLTYPPTTQVPPARTLASCARAATAAELAYRIDVPIAPSRGVRVVALDDGAAAMTARVAAREWVSARFLVADATGAGDDPADMLLHGIGGPSAGLEEHLVDADVVMMIASNDSAATGAYLLGYACWQRSIMTAGLVLDGLAAPEVVAALRPHARVLLPAADESDIVEMLIALRA